MNIIFYYSQHNVMLIELIILIYETLLVRPKLVQIVYWPAKERLQSNLFIVL